ncbi:DUF1249 domain-containing protein [Marinobacter lutaoensis]|jgi:uncharacterized protein YqiB (DUF1249 family)|uniref:Cytoplasmic protein n=1 Tax=Marinobacter lutaoensis TaxID=135739 RepID=A0A1V2DWM8_9GAMM|nr:DUF1249 domain-containing protein [Marinobacter lutaoensis]MBE02639.1 DUF1249 domain-containing protein [Marinobacter sp.]MBI44077.1 DUF1249 domain-containing protein [Oceanospirillales bacterium]NVD35563.1 DUF1249 domain-containing protein [Marinobacter lutaoensis]ONF44671.1 hypothetical protein BTO32_04285 [Marinobacter lutaoensis]|tara:strand:+ start:2290 stop:2775 length:486 start_codon:yes stop_codon:yes gene_type:complete
MTEWIRRPKPYVPDLRQLGALCEGNYQRLHRLRQLEVAGCPVSEFELHREHLYLGRVRIQVLQTARYTETLLLEQTHNAGRWLNNPEMTVRVYHDAAMAEVISCYRDRRIAPANDYPNRFMHHPDEKVQVNAFLADWLDFCLRFGHLPMEQPAWSAGEGLE